MKRHLLIFHLIALTMHLVKSEVDMSELELLENDDDMLQCFNALSCENGKFYEFKNCMTINLHKPDKEKELRTKFFNIFAPGESEDKSYDRIAEAFCPMDLEKQKKTFDDMLAEVLEQYMGVCDGQDVETCEDLKNAFECIMTVIEKGTNDGFCNL